MYTNMYWCNEVDISTSVVIAAPCGGPVIVIRDRTKLVSVKTVGKPIISVYTSSGKIISSFVVYKISIELLIYHYNKESFIILISIFYSNIEMSNSV